MLALSLARFPARRWADWLTHRAHALYRVERTFRARMDGPCEREYCHSYMRHWLCIGLRKAGWKYADLLPPGMWAGYPATDYPIARVDRQRLPAASRRRLARA